MTTQLDAVRSGTGPTSSPYQGLMPYTEAEADYFFGREGEIVLIANNARANRFSVLYGPSGVGKSSVLQAGVVHHIRNDNRRRQERYGDLETVVAYLKEWRDDPYAALAAEIAAAFRDAGATSAEIPAGDLVGAALRLCADTGADLVVILDQFEEFSLYHRPDVTDFAEVIARLTAPATSVNVLVAIREDALSWLDEFEGIVPDVFANTLRLDHLDEDAARSAITEPLRRYNELVPDKERREIEPGLVEALLHEVQAGRVKVDQLAESTSPASSTADHADEVRIEAPYLQLVLTRLWDEETRQQSGVLRLSTLRELGGAQEIVRQHLDRVMREFSPPDLAVLADAFGHLVTPSGSKIAHRPSDLAEFSGHDRAKVASLLHRLTEQEQRILREVPPPLDEPHAEPRYEIFHDVLAVAVLDWRRRFLAEAEQAELVAEKEQSEKVARETRNRLRKARALIGAMALLLIACVALAGWAVQSRSSAQDAKERSQKSERQALKSESEALLSERVNDFNQVLVADPSRALEQGLGFEFDEDSDPDGRLQAAFRGAMDAADTDVVVDLGKPVVLASFVGDNSLVAVTNEGRVLVWDVASEHPLRLDEVPRIDQAINDGRVLQAETAVSGSFLVVTTFTGQDVNGGNVERHVSSVDLDTGDVQRLDLDRVDQPFVSVPSGGSRDRLLVYDGSGHAVVWDVADNRTDPLPRLGRQIDNAAIDSSGSYVAALVRGTSSKVVVRSVTGGQVASTPLASNLSSAPTVFTGVVEFSTGSSVDPNDPVLVIHAQGLQSEVSRWDVLNQAKPTPMGDDFNWRQVYEVADLATSVASNQTLGRIAVAGDKTVTIFKHDGTFESQTAPSQDWITDVQTDPADSTVFALAANEGYVELYRTNLNPPRPMWTFRGHRGTVNDLSFSADGQHLVTAGADGTVRVWRMPPQMDYEWSVPDWVLGARYTPDGKYVFGYSPLGSYVTRSGEDGGIKFAQASLDGQASGMDPAPDGIRAVVLDYYCSVPDEVSVLKRVKAVPLDVPDGGGCASAVAWNPDPASAQIIAGTYDNALISWDANTGKVTNSVNLKDSGTSTVAGVAFSGDGTKVIVGSVDGPNGRIHVLNATDLTTVAVWPTDSFATIDTSADGRYVVTGGGSARAVTVWDFEDHDQPLHVFSEAPGSLGQVTMSPDADASRVAVTSSDGKVYVWARDSGQLLAVMRRHSDAADEATFDPANLDHMYSAGDDGFMVSYTCEVCALGADELKDAAEDRLAQEIDLDD